MKISAPKSLLLILLFLIVGVGAILHVRSRERVAGVVSTGNGSIQAVVVPHHEVGSALISQAVEQALANKPDIAGVVIVSPDHYAREDAFVVTAKQVPGLNIDDALVDKLVATIPFVLVDNQKMSLEHGVLVPAQVVKQYYPEAMIVPLAISPFYTQEQFDSLILELTDLGQDWLWVMSTDFSHNLVTGAAFKNHELMIQVLTDFDYRTLDQLNDEFTDARVPLQVFMRVMQNLGATSWQTWNQGHSSQFLGMPNNLGTSYVIGGYSRSE